MKIFRSQRPSVLEQETFARKIKINFYYICLMARCFVLFQSLITSESSCSSYIYDYLVFEKVFPLLFLTTIEIHDLITAAKLHVFIRNVTRSRIIQGQECECSNCSIVFCAFTGTDMNEVQLNLDIYEHIYCLKSHSYRPVAFFQ